MILKHIVVPGSKKMLQKQKDGSMSKKHRSQPERAFNDQIWNNLSNKVNNIVLNYNAKYKINMHMSKLTLNN